MREELEKLRNSFAMIDLMSSDSMQIRCLVLELKEISCRMEPDHHKMAHVHITYGNNSHAASYGIKDVQRIVVYPKSQCSSKDKDGQTDLHYPSNLK